ncbi:hypothetical protein ACIBEJ_02675 [Nonomuraea sp. NPDC050790]|uniref:hypothetical protein n=1 Tax=Nonomuraea sp. NPDC050790 TaxID=3364371 RepID=UPI0037AC2AF2
MTLTGIAGASLMIGGLSGVRAVVFDFNGTIAGDDEPQYRVHAETAAAEPAVTLDRPFFQARGTVSPVRPETVVLIRSRRSSPARRAPRPGPC